MVYTLNGRLMIVVSSDVLLENILLAMEEIPLSKTQAARIVGSEKKLETLVDRGDIRADKPTARQNGKWFCNGGDVLRHCANHRRKRKKK